MDVSSGHAPSEFSRELITSNVDELAEFQVGKNRIYTQTKPGTLNARYIDALVGAVQLFSERLAVGARIQAAPDSRFIPFAFIFPESGEYHFCHQTPLPNGFVQASGGVWDVFFKNQIEYVGTAFSRQYFYDSYQTLIGEEVPAQFLVSKLVQTDRFRVLEYARWVKQILEYLLLCPELLVNSKVSHLLCSQALSLTLNALTAADDQRPDLCPSKRLRGVRRVIDYLQVHAVDLPDMQVLCRVANLSERTLQYGFLDHVGITPIQYVRAVRLNGARLQLLRANPTGTRVVDIALHWGFIELGRFAREYKKLFGELPSETLRYER